MKKLTYVPGLNSVWSDETTGEIVGLLQKKYMAFLESEEFLIESGFNKEQVQLKMTLAKKDRSVAYPIEAVCPIDKETLAKPSELANLMLDYLDIYWNEYLTGDRDTYVPLDWSKHECEGYEFYLRGFVRNLDLEAQADALFKKHGYGEYEIVPISSDD